MRFLQSKVFTILSVLASVFLIWSLIRLWPNKISVQNKLDNLEEKIAETERSNTSLAKMLDYFKSPAFLERESKLKLNVRRPDENVIFIYPNKEAQGDRQATSGLEDSKIQVNVGIGTTNLEKWIKYLFK